MKKRILWEPGMRVSNKILQASDDVHYAWVDKAIALASAGRFGLIPNSQPFNIKLTIDNEYISINKLSCFAVTAGYHLIDIDSVSSVKCEKRLSNLGMTDDLFLVVKSTDKWKKTNDGFEELDYEYDIIRIRTIGDLPQNAFPVAHLIASNNGWNQDNDFVPPCLFVSSHEKYKSILGQFISILKEIEEKTKPLPDSEVRKIMVVLLPFIQQIRIDTDWRRDTMTPAELMANIQKIAGNFYTVSELLDSYNPDGPGNFREYAKQTYFNSLDVYPFVKEGVDLCEKLKHRIENGMQNAKETPAELPSENVLQPYIAEEYRHQTCKSNQISIPVRNVAHGAIVRYSIDGNYPNLELGGSGYIIYDTSNDRRNGLQDKIIVIKLMSIYGNKTSEVASFEIIIHYEYDIRNRYII